MTDIPYFQLLHLDPFRPPNWRWERAQYLVDQGKYFSTRRDDTATGIAIKYLREMERRSSKGLKRRIHPRFSHVDRACREFEAANGHRLEMETRMLARQSDTAIGYQLDLPPETVQAYRDLFFDIEGRIEAKSYILREVIGFRSSSTADVTTLMRLSAFLQGPEVIGPWMTYIRQGWNGVDLSTEQGRLMATIHLAVESQQLSESPKHYRSLTRNASILLDSNSGPRRPVSVATAFSSLCSQIEANLPLPVAELPPFSYFTTPENTHPARQILKSVK